MELQALAEKELKEREEKGEEEEVILRQYSSIKVSTIDAFQGAEKEVIILSTSRSSENADMDFVGSPTRLNVAVTRAKRQLIVVGNYKALQHNHIWRKIFMKAKEKNGVMFGTELLMFNGFSWEKPK